MSDADRSDAKEPDAGEPDLREKPKWQLGAMYHLGLTVSDIEQSIEFYRDLLGMTLIRRRPSVTAEYVSLQTGYEGVELSVASLKVNGESRQSLELVQYVNNPGPASDPATNRPGSSHLCLVVDDLRSCYEDLASRAVQFKSEPVTITEGPNKGGLVIYLRDPDGYTLELFQPVI